MSSTVSGVRIVDMPDLGVPTDASSIVAEHAGSGRFSMSNLSSYLSGHFLSVGMPDLGVPTNAAFIVGEQGSAGRFSITNLNSYLSGHFLSLTGGGVSGLVSFLQGATSQNDTTSQYGFANAAGTQKGLVGWLGSDNDVRMQHLSAATYLSLSAAGDFVYSGGTGFAAKIGGGTWGTVSDARIKTVQGDYTLGLPEVLQLNPKSFVFKGNDAPPDGESPHAQVAANGKVFVGLIAQDVETVLPALVAQQAGYIDGAAVTDLRSVDTSDLLFVLLNAVKTLAARVDALEAAVP